ncbi:hypothetical protein [Metabacillus iocasae]|uniref:Low-complexity protein n=1 Tax=Priestia iocasae TaxID=2291674 RepID=A0ABS2QXV2_9BACI|nr:hypothetical protein [Metabacillus iocasae]MBM7704310.1 putative low-complexity protein [Metabacillus iocasae]
MKKKFRVAAIAGAVSLGLLTAGQASAATPNCHVGQAPQQGQQEQVQQVQQFDLQQLINQLSQTAPTK